MRGRTFALSQKELQRVSVISSCAKGDMACARGAAPLSLIVRPGRGLHKRFSGEERGGRGGPEPPALPPSRRGKGGAPKKAWGGGGGAGWGARQPRTAQPP